MINSGPTYVKLVDQSDNSGGTGAEAVYASSVVVTAGTTLDLNGLHLYARAAQVERHRPERLDHRRSAHRRPDHPGSSRLPARLRLRAVPKTSRSSVEPAAPTP